jgi:hypothetical protein
LIVGAVTVTLQSETKLPDTKDSKPTEPVGATEFDVDKVALYVTEEPSGALVGLVLADIIAFASDTVSEVVDVVPM